MSDLRLIEHGFPCHQVGAETRRERNASSALPPLYFLHVWWARRPLTPSRAAVLGSLAPADADVEQFVRELGIEKTVVPLGDSLWVLLPKLIDRIEKDRDGNEVLPVDTVVLNALEKEVARREENLEEIAKLRRNYERFLQEPILDRWEEESAPLQIDAIQNQSTLSVDRIMADPAHVNDRIAFASSDAVVEALGKTIRWAPEDLYGYSRGYGRAPNPSNTKKVVLDLTSGGGSIPFEALRCGHQVIANELNPVAATILHATLDFPAQFGPKLFRDIEKWGEQLLSQMEIHMDGLAPFSPLNDVEKKHLREHCNQCPEIIPQFDTDESDHTGLLYTRTVTCPHCSGEAPLLNTLWLSKQAGDKWCVTVEPQTDKTVRFHTHRIEGDEGPRGEDLDAGTVTRGVGTCLHCKQAIDGDEVKRQARGESPLGQWRDVLYAVVAIRYEPVLDKKGQPVRYKSGERKGEIKTKKVRFFRPPNRRDFDALDAAEARLKERWAEFEAKDLIPTEKLPDGDKTREPLRYGMLRWCDLFTPRQLLGHLTLIDELNKLKPSILDELGPERSKAVATYLQFAIDKGVDYNCRQTRWEFTRGVIKGCFGRHDYSLKWTFGEMIFTGPNSGAAWGLSQILDAYTGIAELLKPVYERHKHDGQLPLRIINGDASHLEGVTDESVDLVCMDPPYYNNVQYAELSDFYYVWQRKTLRDLYPENFSRRLSNKRDEAVANPARDGSAKKAKAAYERMMGAIFAEARRVLKPDGIMTLMFTHKTQDAWETLTRALIENGWNITSAFPVESESAYSTHQKDMAAAASSIFIACRKRAENDDTPATWTGFGGSGVQERIRETVREGLGDFARLKLGPVDEMVGAYGLALRVLSQNWPVLDGDEPVSPVRAMNEASRVVAENQIHRITKGQLSVTDLSSEAAMALTLFGIFGHAKFAYDEALNLSKSLNIAIEGKSGGYNASEGRIGTNAEETGAARSKAEESGYYAPLVRRGSTLRLALPEERSPRRMKNPQSEWDILHGSLLAYREGDIPVARAYLDQHSEGNDRILTNLLKVWAAEVGDEALEKEARALLFGLGGER